MYFKSILLAHTMAVMRLKSEAKNLYLSYLWWVLEPMLFVSVFYLVFAVILNNGREDFIVFLMCGKIPLLWYTKTLSKNAAALTAGKGLMGQRDFPKHVFPYANTLESSYREVVVYLFLMGFLIAFGYNPSQTWLYVPVLAAVMLLLIVSTGMVAAYVTVYIPDLRMVIAMFAMALLFTSGVFWDVRALAPETAELVLLYNPFAFMLDAHRQLLMYNHTVDWWHLAGIAGGAGVLLLIMHGVLASQSQNIARRLYS